MSFQYPPPIRDRLLLEEKASWRFIQNHGKVDPEEFCGHVADTESKVCGARTEARPRLTQPHQGAPRPGLRCPAASSSSEARCRLSRQRARTHTHISTPTSPHQTPEKVLVDIDSRTVAMEVGIR